MTDIKNTSVIDFEDISDEQMNAMIDGTLTEFDEGDLVDGTVVKIEHDEVLVDIGFKSEGVIPSRELSIRKDADPSDIVELGEKIEALVLQKEDKDGRLILSKKRAEYERAWIRVEEKFKAGEVVTGEVIEVVKGGLILDIGLRGFLPASLVDLRRVKDLDMYLGTEIEFENGGTGATMEIEHNKEGGEIETEIEKGGEVALEQLHITKHFSNAFNLRIGHMIVPVGLTNSHHEPTLFFGTVRPESETAILPSTWHETGIAVLGYLGDFRYEAMLVSGLDPNGFSSENWIGSGRQKIFEVSKMTNPAVAARVEYSGIRNLRLAVSGYCGNTAKNSSKPYAMSGVKGTVAIGSFDAQYLGRNLIARANFVYGTVSDAKAIYDINRKYFNNTGYPITPFGKAAMAYGAEVGYDVLSWANTRNRLFPFVRWEYYNTGQKIDRGAQELPRYKRPKKIIFAEVPRNATGKIEKPALRKKYGADKLVEQQNRS